MALYLPTPPTPPTIDKGEATESTPRIDAHKFFEIPFKREEKPAAPVEKPAENRAEKPVENTPPPAVERKVTTPEDMARDAVANGAGALTKKTITRPENETPAAPAQSQNLPVTSERSNRGKEILREFQEEDRQNFQSVETPRNFNSHQGESYSGIYWVVMLVFVGIVSIVFVKKFLLKKNPKLKKSELFEDSSERLKAVSEKISAPKVKPIEKVPVPNVKAVEKNSAPIKKTPPKKDDDKGKFFEVRV